MTGVQTCALPIYLAIKEVLEDPRAVQKSVVEQELFLKELKLGMVLTRDIYSSRGVLVAERGEVTPTVMDSLKRYQMYIPLNRTTHIVKQC